MTLAIIKNENLFASLIPTQAGSASCKLDATLNVFLGQVS
jgi:hypothetical protein